MNRRQVMIAAAASILGFPFAKATASNPAAIKNVPKIRWDVLGRMGEILRGIAESKCEDAGASAIRNVSVGLWENDSRFYISVCGHLVDQNEHKVSLSEFSLDCHIRYMAGWQPYAGQIRAGVRARLSNS